MKKNNLLLTVFFLSLLIIACQDELETEPLVENQIESIDPSQYLAQKYKSVDVENLKNSLFFKKFGANSGINFSTTNSSESDITDSLDIERAVEFILEDSIFYTIPYYDYFEEHFFNLHIKEFDSTIVATRIRYQEIDDSLSVRGEIINLDFNPITASNWWDHTDNWDCHIEFFEYADDCCIYVEAYEVCEYTGGGGGPPSGGDNGPPSGGGGGGSPGGGGTPPTTPTTTPIDVIIPENPDDCDTLQGDLNGDCQLDEYEICIMTSSISDRWQCCGFSTSNCDDVDQELYDCIENDIGCEEIDPCKKISKRVTDDSNFRTALLDLANKHNDNFESKVIMLQNGDVSTGSGNSGQPFIDLPAMSSKYTQVAHNHPALVDGKPTYSVFSLGDLRRFSELLYNGKLKSGKFVAYLTTAKGTRYALTIDNSTKFTDGLFYYWNKKTINSSDSLSIKQKYMQSYQDFRNTALPYFGDINEPNITPIIKAEDTDNEQVLEYFLEFLSQADIGVTLFEADENFENFTELSLNNGQVQRNVCP